jgi:hypothetical protein
MIKRQGPLPGLVLIAVLALARCPQAQEPGGGGLPFEVENTSWVSEGGAALAFHGGGRADLDGVWHDYEYDPAARQGSIPNIGSFSVSEGGEALSFPSFRNGGPLDFVPFVEAPVEEPGPPEEALEGVWKWFSQELVFFTGKQARLNNAIEYDYAYDGETKTGEISGLGAFALGGEGDAELSFAAYQDGGAALFKKQVLDATLRGFKYAWGTMVLEFSSPSRAWLGDKAYSYVYTDSEKKAQVATLGEFTLSDDYQTLSFANFKGWSHPAVFTKFEGDFAPPESLVGTAWTWAGLILSFYAEPSGERDGKVIMIYNNGLGRHPEYLFNYSPAPGLSSPARPGILYNGYITTDPDGDMSQIVNRADLGCYRIDGDLLIFDDYKDYPHGADFVRIQ